MTALYSHTTRASGTILTASIYNADHQNHINNGVPAQHDDYSATVAEMQTTTDPGEVGTESQAISTAGELERLRFAILEIKRMLDGTVAQWYSTPFAGVDNSGRPPLPPWYIQGLDIRVAATSPAFVEVATGWCRSSNDTMNLKVSTALHRSVSSVWVAAATGGGMGVTFPAVNEQAYVFVFKTQASGYDIGFDTAISASNLLTRASASDARRIGIVFAPTAFGGVVQMMTREGETWFTGTAVVGNVKYTNQIALATAIGSVELPRLTPTSFPVRLHLYVGVDAAPTTGFYVAVHDHLVTVVGVQGNWLEFTSGALGAGGDAGYTPIDIETGPSGGFKAMAANNAGAAVATGVNFRIRGFLDRRRGIT